VFYIKELFALMKDPSSNMIVLDPLLPITDKYHVIWSSYGDKTYAQLQDVIKSFAYTSTRTITVADRKWTIIILPTSDFMKQVLGWQKWVALGGCILAAVFVSIVIATLIKRVEYNFVMNQLNKERLQLMHESQEKLSGYLEKIANQEQTLRSTIDAIPEWILVVDNYGKILSTNQSFDKKFGMSKKKLEEGVNVNDLFSKIEDGFYRHGEIDTMETQILDRYKSEVKVAVTTRPINNSYLLVIRNLTEQSTLLEQLKQQNEKMKQMDSMFELDQNLEDEKYKARLYQFCQMEKNSENLEFLDAVKNYKRMNVKDRIEKQQVIFDTFIKLGSEKQLNISRELSEEMRHNLEGSIGASTIFDGIVRHVKTILVLDVLPRFKDTRTREKE
jgi:PAS domain S-box-containing protein